VSKAQREYERARRLEQEGVRGLIAALAAMHCPERNAVATGRRHGKRALATLLAMASIGGGDGE